MTITKSSEIDWQSMRALYAVDRKVDREHASITLWYDEYTYSREMRDLALVAQMPYGLHPNVYQAAVVWQISELIFRLYGFDAVGQNFMQWIIHEAAFYEGDYVQGEDVDNRLRFGRAVVDMLLWNFERRVGKIFATVECKAIHGYYADPRSFIRIKGSLFAIGVRTYNS